MLDAVLSGGVVSEQQRLQLAQFRQIHRVSDEEHAEQLRLLGWTAKQYEAGKNAATAPPPTDARHHAPPTTARAVAWGEGEASVDVDAAQIGQVGRGWQSKLGWHNVPCMQVIITAPLPPFPTGRAWLAVEARLAQRASAQPTSHRRVMATDCL